MKVLLGQLAPTPAAEAANVTRIAQAIAEQPEADLAVFPELFVSGYRPRAALPWPDQAFEPIAEAAERASTTAVFGFAEQCGSRWANAVAVITPDGGFAGAYRKTQLFGDFEQRTFTAGDALHVFDTPAGRIGALICFDMEFPETARALAQAGTSVLVTCSANMEPYAADHALAARARALDNRLPHVYVNRVGSEGGLTFVGGSCVIDQSGTVLASLDDSTEEVRCVELPDAAASETDVDYLALLRPDLPVLDAASTVAQGGDA